MDPATNPSDIELFHRIARELADIRKLLTKSINAEAQAEAEIPALMRRFANYFHDIVHIKGEYHSLGLKCPTYIDREMERCADRFRHLLDDLHIDGGAFEQVRRNMAERPGNRYDHTRQLAAPPQEN